MTNVPSLPRGASPGEVALPRDLVSVPFSWGAGNSTRNLDPAGFLHTKWPCITGAGPCHIARSYVSVLPVCLGSGSYSLPLSDCCIEQKTRHSEFRIQCDAKIIDLSPYQVNQFSEYFASIPPLVLVVTLHSLDLLELIAYPSSSGLAS